MATWNKATLANKTLEYIGVKPAGQAASGEHVNLVQEFIDSAYDSFQEQGIAPYSIEAIPEWAQIPWMKYLAVEVGPRFGKPYPDTFQEKSIREMTMVVFGGPRGALPTRSEDF